MISNKYVLVFPDNVVACFCVGLESTIAPRLVQDPTKMGWYYFEKKHHHDSMKMVMIENDVISIECDENENDEEI